jgi:serine/threonine protein kinase
MALASGTKLGPYEFQLPLGAGGMGEVYRARDTRLQRIVAIKILPQSLSETEIYDLDIATGQRKLFTHFSPNDKAAAINLTYFTITPDGAHFGYCVPRIYSTLFVAKDVR